MKRLSFKYYYYRGAFSRTAAGSSSLSLVTFSWLIFCTLLIVLNEKSGQSLALRGSGGSSLKVLRSKLTKTFFWHRNLTYENNPRLSTPELIEKAGFKSETHTVVTEDGYILTVHRIPGAGVNDVENEDKEEQEKDVDGGERVKTKRKRPVVLYFPGLLACDDSLVSTSIEQSLPLTLASEYDVWLGNPRGCYYSRRHIIKSTSDPEFWNFSWHEIGYYDLSKVIDYILKETGHEKLNYIGHSMGTTINYVLLSTRPEYNAKINMSISLAPVAFMGHMKSPLLHLLVPTLRLIPQALYPIIATGGSGDYMPRNDFTDNLIKEICYDDNHRILCLMFFFVAIGFDYCQTDRSQFDKLISVFPAGSSLWTSIHYLQSIRTKEFRQFDYGSLGNLVKYRSIRPPKYNLTNIQAPHTFFYADNDGLSDKKDVFHLISRLKPSAVRENCRIKYSRFNHFDYMTANDAKLLVNDRVVRVLKGHSCRQDGEDDNKDEPLQCDPRENALNYLSNPIVFFRFVQRFFRNYYHK